MKYLHNFIYLFHQELKCNFITCKNILAPHYRLENVLRMHIQLSAQTSGNFIGKLQKNTTLLYLLIGIVMFVYP